MENSTGVGAMAVFAVSGSVVLVSLQLYKRLLSDFMKKVESEFGGHGVEKFRPKRKVRFAADVHEPSSNNKEYRLRRSRLGAANDDQAQVIANMPPNRRVLYEGVIKHKALKGHSGLQV